MSTPAGILKPEETLALLTEKAKVAGESFTIKVNRKQGLGSLYQTVAVLTGANLAHIGQPEMWLGPLCGGGDFQLAIFHTDDPATRIGGFLFTNIKAPATEVRPEVVGSPGWVGPPEIVFPKPNGANPFASAQSVSAPGVSGPALTTGNMPPQQWAGNHLVHSGGTVAQMGSAGPMGPMGPVGPMGPMGFDYYAEQRRREEEQRREEERRREEAHQRRLAELRAQEDELKRKEEVAKLRAEALERENKLRAEIAEKEARAREEALRAVNNTTSTKELILGLAPVILQFIQSSREQQNAMLNEMRRSQEQANARFEALVEKLLQSQVQRPEMTAMLELMKASSASNAEMMGRMVEATSMVAQMSTSMIETIADLNLGGAPQGHPVLEAVKEGVRALSALNQGANAGAKKMVQQVAKASQQLPAMTQPAVPQQAATQPVVQQTAAQPVVAQPVPKPNMPPAFDGLPTTPGANGTSGQVQYPANPVDRLEAMIRAHHEPVEEVAKFFFDSLNTSEMRAALAAVNGDPFQLIGERLGAVWTMDEENTAYLQKLGAVVDKMGVELGVFEPEEGEGDDENAAQA
jgi:hypothetical protein